MRRTTLKKVGLYLALSLLCPLALFAQGGFTTVTGTVTDPNGLPYACGTISAQLITAGGAAPTLNGGGFTTQTSPVSLGCQTTPGTGAAGSFAMRLADSGVIVPGNTTWRFTVNMTPGIPPPAGNGPQSFSYTTAINCSTNTPSTCTGNTMSISAQLSALAPALSQVVSALQQGTTNPSCSAGQAFLFLNTASNQLLICNNGTLTTASGAPATMIDLKQFGVVADLRTCQGTNGVLTISSPTFTCTGANFCNSSTVACPAGQTSDVGKRINGTGGCCNLSVPVNANTQVIPNNTTILTVNSATSATMSANATVTLNAVSNLFVWWNTDDDNAVSLADTAYQNYPTCTGILWPATPFGVKNPHFNTPNPNCESLEHGGIVGNRVKYIDHVGWGSSNSVMYLDSTLNSNTPCPSGGGLGCFFSGGSPSVPVHAQHLGISGGWNQVPNGGGHSYILLNLGQGSQFEDVRTVGFAAGDGTTIGTQTASFSNFLDYYSAGFGNTALENVGASNVFRGGEFSNVNGTCFDVEGSAGVTPAMTYGLSFGTCGGPTVKVGGGPWISNGDLVYGNVANNTCVFITGTGAQAVISGGIVGSNGNCGTNGVLLQGAAQVTLQNTVVNSSTNAVNSSSSGSKFIDQCGNSYTGGIATVTGSIIVPCVQPLGSTFAVAPAAGILNCASSASPAVCGAYATGSVTVAATATTEVVNTTAVGANSQIILTFDASLGTKLGVTCNTTEPALFGVSARTAGTSFTITASASVTNPACFNYQIIN
jgi:hypothetical protein